MKEYLNINEIITGKPKNKTAVIDGERKLSYGQFDEAVSVLAEHLSGIFKGNTAGVVLIDKSIEAVIAYFAIMKAGGYYVPVDIESGEEMIGHILGTCKPRVIISIGSFKDKIDRVSSDVPVVTIHFDSFLEVDYKESALDQQRVCAGEECIKTPDDTAYIIFTSGSTGKPKAVMISHGSLIAFVHTAHELASYSEDMVFLGVNPFYFDGSLVDIYSTFYAGGTLVLLKRIILPSDLTYYMSKYEITDTLLQSSVVKLLATRYSKLEHMTFPQLRTIWYGGEGCPVGILKHIKTCIPQVTFIHGYGPTETTHTATALVFQHIPDTCHDYMPIGYPLQTIECYAINEYGELIKPGESGEFMVGGVQIMKGYLNDEERNKKVLINHHFKKGQKVYRTGDFVTINEDGQYIFLGRNDNLVKVSGYLVSLQMIQNAALRNKNLKDAIAFTCEDNLGQTLVYLLVVRCIDSIVTVEQVMRELRSTLPFYMVPEEIRFFREDELPMNRNGKFATKEIKNIFFNYDSIT